MTIVSVFSLRERLVVVFVQEELYERRK
jgi:hypothetical protein